MMKIRIVISLAMLTFAGTLIAQNGKPKNRLDSLSYAVGVSMYNQTTQLRMKLNYDMVADGLKAAADSNAILTTESANNYIGRVVQQVHEAEIRESVELGEKFLLQNMKADGVKVTQSGLQYIVIKQGYGAKPTMKDKVRVNYAGYLLDGTRFDSSEERGGPAEISLNGIIRGWQEALQMMSPGSEWVIWVPNHLAYGDRPMGKDIPAGATLMFEIELLDVIKKE